MTKAHGALSDFDMGLVSRESCISGIREAFCGVSDYVRTTGVCGGNMGVSAAVARKYCFYPTGYRVEDGFYAELAPYFAGQSACFPEDPPLALHRHAAGKISTLFDYYVSSLRGSQVGMAAKYAAENGCSPALAAVEGTERIMSGFLKRDERELSSIEQTCGRLGDPELAGEMQRIIRLDPSVWLLDNEKVAEEVGFFVQCQNDWPSFVGSQRFLERTTAVP